MTFYGFDDSQRSLNGNCKFLRENGLEKTIITVHFLYSDEQDLNNYIWTLGAPDISHGKEIAKFLQKHCSNDDKVIACPHYGIYPAVASLAFLILVGPRELRNLYYLYTRADKCAREMSKEIYDAFIQGDFERIEVYMQHYFGVWPLKNIYAPHGI
jgi:hypothetical protein